MNGAATAEQMRDWCVDAGDELAAAIASSPDAIIPAYPEWSGRDLARHMLRVFGNAAIALRGGSLEPPRPAVAVARDAPAGALAAAVRDAVREAQRELERSPHEVVWTPIGVGTPEFWRRRLLREALLHRWDAQQALGRAAEPTADQALELVDEFLDSYMPRTLGEGGHGRSGLVEVRAADRRWTVDLSDGTVDDEPGRASTSADGEPSRAPSAVVTGDPAAVWLWLVRRDGAAGPVHVEDHDGSGRFFTGLIDQLSRPKD